MKKGEWVNTHDLVPTSVMVDAMIGEYRVALPENAEIMGVGLQDDEWIVVIVKDRHDSKIVNRKMLVLGDGQPIEYKYTKYIGSVRMPMGKGGHSWRHVFEITRPDDDEEPVKKDGKVLLAATPGC